METCLIYIPVARAQVALQYKRLKRYPNCNNLLCRQGGLKGLILIWLNYTFYIRIPSVPLAYFGPFQSDLLTSLG